MRFLSFVAGGVVLTVGLFAALSWGFDTTDVTEEEVATFEPELEVEPSPSPTSPPLPTATATPAVVAAESADNEALANTGSEPGSDPDGDSLAIEYFVPNYVGAVDREPFDAAVSAALPTATPAPAVATPVPTTAPVVAPDPTATPIEQPTPTPEPQANDSSPTPEPEPEPTSGDNGGGPTAAQWAALRNCESGGNYSILNPSGQYRGAYQFSVGTWDGVARQFRPDLVGVDPAAASPADQDAMALALYSLRGAGPWPTCGRHLS